MENWTGRRQKTGEVEGIKGVNNWGINAATDRGCRPRGGGGGGERWAEVEKEGRDDEGERRREREREMETGMMEKIKEWKLREQGGEGERKTNNRASGQGGKGREQIWLQLFDDQQPLQRDSLLAAVRLERSLKYT